MGCALIQQNPVLEGGGYFKLDWIKYYDARPNNLRIYGASDYAVTADGGDFTEHGVAGIDPDANLYLLRLVARAKPPRMSGLMSYWTWLRDTFLCLGPKNPDRS